MDKIKIKDIKSFANPLDLEIKMITRNKLGVINPINIDDRHNNRR